VFLILNLNFSTFQRDSAGKHLLEITLE